MADTAPAEDFKIKVLGVNVLPAFKKVLKLQSDTKRRETTAQMSAPDPKKPVLDLYDCKQENPYTTEEVLEGKVWRVRYKMEGMSYTRSENKKNAKMIGMDPTTKEYREKVLAAAKEYGEEALAAAKKDLENAVAWWKKETWTKDEVFTASPLLLNMIVVKLSGGGLLLYAPVKIHKEAAHLLYSWLQSLGPVQWLMVPSATHTLLLHDAIEAFPEAKLVGPEAAEAKLRCAKACAKFDYVTTNGDELNKLKAALAGEGVRVDAIAGDVASNAVFLLAHEEVLLTCDLLFGHHDGHGLFNYDEAAMKEWKGGNEMTGVRLFKFGELGKPNSLYLPKFRFWMMDPESMGLFCYDKPAEDGSSKRDMAASLRKMLTLPFSKAVGVHFDEMEVGKYKMSIDAAWNWLDGKPLI